MSDVSKGKPKQGGKKKPQGKKKFRKGKQGRQQPSIKRITRNTNGLQRHQLKLRNGMTADKRDFRVGLDKLNATTHQYMANVQESVAFRVQVSANTFASPALGVVSYALSKGWMEGASDPTDPFFAFGYLFSMFQSYAQNAVPAGTMVPKFVALIGQSLIGKKVKRMGGHVHYYFDFQYNSAPSDTYLLGPNGNVKLSLQIPQNTGIIDGIWRTGTSPGAYNAVHGAKAWQSLLEFLEKSTLGIPSSMLKMVPSNKPNKMTRDASAFAATYANPGGGAFATGGFGSIIQSEVPIFRPIFSTFYQNPGQILDVNRYPNFSVSFAGDGFMLGAGASWLHEKWLDMKVPPAFKCINLVEFVEVYAIVLKKAFELMLTDPQVQQMLNDFTTQPEVEAYVDSLRCPLSIQDFALLIRAQMMNLLKDTQCFVQSIFPRSSGSSGTNLFVACTAGSNTCGLPNTTQMEIPDILVENMRACTYSVVENVGGKNPILAIPILGANDGDVIQSSDYEVTYNTPQFTGMTVNLFANDPATEISVIDGTVPSGDVCFINDPSALQGLTTYFNTWLKKTSTLEQFICTLDTVGTDAGCLLLSNMNCTTYITPVPIESSQRKARQEYYNELRNYNFYKSTGKTKVEMPKPKWELSGLETKFGIKDPNCKHIYTSPFASWAIESYSFRFDPLQTVWENVQQFWVKPTLIGITETTVSTSNQISRMNAQQQEFIQMIPSISLGGSTSAPTQLTLAQQHDQYASLMVGARNVLAKGTSVQKMFEELNKKGEASIFSDLAGAFSEVTKVVAPIALNIGAPLAMSLLAGKQSKGRITN